MNRPVSPFSASRLLTVRPWLLGEFNMKTLRIVAACAAALVVGHAWAQNQPGTTETATAQPAQDVGGVTDMSRSDAGAPRSLTRQQVYQDLLQSQQSGEQSRLHELYHGQ
jgi:hypothetical protein